MAGQAVFRQEDFVHHFLFIFFPVVALITEFLNVRP